MLEPELNAQDYLRQVELLALDVVAAAREEGWQTYGDNPLQRSINELARILRHHHFEQDGCVEPDRPVLHLGGAALFEPGETEGQQVPHDGDHGVEGDSGPAGQLGTGPRRSQIRAVIRGWVGPITLSPGYAGTRGLGGC